MRTSLVLVLTLLASGCGSVATRGEAGDVADSQRADYVALDRLGNARAGESMELPSDNPLGVDRATVAVEYLAASGRVCRRVMPADGGRDRTLCRLGDGDWSLIRSLDPAATLFHGPSGAVAGASDALAHTIRQDETLWLFAARTTGDGTNWRRIAQANAIPDPNRVEAGLQLTVPRALLTDAR